MSTSKIKTPWYGYVITVVFVVVGSIATTVIAGGMIGLFLGAIRWTMGLFV